MDNLIPKFFPLSLASLETFMIALAASTSSLGGGDGGGGLLGKKEERDVKSWIFRLMIH